MTDVPSPASADDPMAPAWMSHREHEGERQPELTALLLQLKTQLKAAIEHEKDEEHLLKVTQCTVELGITWTVEASGEVKFWVLDFTGKASRENAQTMTVTLAPVGDDAVLLR